MFLTISIAVNQSDVDQKALKADIQRIWVELLSYIGEVKPENPKVLNCENMSKRGQQWLW